MQAVDITVNFRMKYKLKLNPNRQIIVKKSQISSKIQFDILKNKKSLSFSLDHVATDCYSLHKTFDSKNKMSIKNELDPQNSKIISPDFNAEESKNLQKSFFISKTKISIKKKSQILINLPKNCISLVHFLSCGHMYLFQNKNTYYYFKKISGFYGWVLDFEHPGIKGQKNQQNVGKNVEYITISSKIFVHTIGNNHFQINRESFLKDYELYEYLRKLNLFKHFKAIKIIKLWIFKLKKTRFFSVCADFNSNFIANKKTLYPKICLISEIFVKNPSSVDFHFKMDGKIGLNQLFLNLHEFATKNLKILVNKLKLKFRNVLEEFLNKGFSQNTANKNINQKVLNQAAIEMQISEIRNFILTERIRFSNIKGLTQTSIADKSHNLSTKKKC